MTKMDRLTYLTAIRKEMVECKVVWCRDCGEMIRVAAAYLRRLQEEKDGKE
jgi:hypothetical protein